MFHTPQTINNFPMPYKINRRLLLKNLLAGMAASSAWVLSKQVSAHPVQLKQNTTTDKSQGYRESEHVRRYYRTINF